MKMKLLLPIILIAVFAGCKKEEDPIPTFTMTFNGQQLHWNNLQLTPTVIHHQSTINGIVYYHNSYNLLFEDLTENKSLKLYFGFDVSIDSIQLNSADRFYNYFGTGANYFEFDDEEATENISYMVAVRYDDGTDLWYNVSAPNSPDNYFNITITSHGLEAGKPTVYFTSNFKCQIKIPNTSTIAPIDVPEFNGKLVLN